MAPAHRDRRQGHPWRHVRPGGEADRAVDGVRDRARSRRRAACRSRRSAASPPGATRPSSSRSGAGNVQVCTAAMTYGFKIVQEMISGLSNFMDAKGYPTIEDFRGRAVPQRDGLAISQPQLCRQGRDRPGSLHQMRPLPHRLRGHLASGDLRDRRRRAQIRRQRRRMRRLQSLRARLPGRELHHAGPQDRGRRSAHRLAITAARRANWTTHPNNPAATKAAE